MTVAGVTPVTTAVKVHVWPLLKVPQEELVPRVTVVAQRAGTIPASDTSSAAHNQR